MGAVFKKQATYPLPPGAEIFVRKGERFARWKDRKGKTRTTPLTTGQDGTAHLPLRDGVPLRAVWGAVDLTTGASAIAPACADGMAVMSGRASADTDAIQPAVAVAGGGGCPRHHRSRAGRVNRPRLTRAIHLKIELPA